MKEELITLKKENIEDLIYEIRGKQVMIDSDLARLYQCSNGTKTINQAVKRHINRFPERFMFKLTKVEYRELLRSQTGTLKNGSRGEHSKYLPYVFTEQGVAMLSAVLRTPVAEKVSIEIMDAFVAMRKYISSNMLEQRYINNLVLEDHENIKLLQQSFQKFEEKKITNETYYNGQIYDAYSKIIEIFKEAKEELIIIDRYADKQVLDMIKDLKVNVLLITKKNNLLKELDIEKYNKQYKNLKVIYSNNYHDRYFIIDKKEIYHSGTSINHAGSKTFSINKWQDKDVIDSFINRLNNIL